MKESMVESVTENTKEIKGNYGPLYIHFIKFENGEKGEYCSKDSTCKYFVAGKIAKYETEETKYGLRIKPVRENTGGYGGKSGNYKPQEPIEFRAATMAVAYAKDLLIAEIARTTVDIPFTVLLGNADTIYNWIMSKVKTKETAQPSESGKHDFTPVDRTDNLTEPERGVVKGKQCPDCYAPVGKPHTKNCPNA